MIIHVNINGQVRDLAVSPGESLMTALRREGYYSVKHGCESGDCGACGVLMRSATDVRASITNTCVMLESVNSGKGTLGQLVNNPDLYHSLNDAAKRLEKALGEVELLAQKIKAEGVKVGL